MCPHPASLGPCPCSGWKDAMTRAQWSHSTEHTGHPVRSTPPERTRHVLAGHLLRSGPTHNHWHAKAPTQNSRTSLEPVHTRSGLRNVAGVGFCQQGPTLDSSWVAVPLRLPVWPRPELASTKGHITGSLSCGAREVRSPCAWKKFSSVAQSCPILCNSMDCSTPGLPVHHQLPRVYSNSCH